MQVLATFTQVVLSPIPAVPPGCNHSMLHVPVWTAQVAMHMARAFKDRLRDSGPAVGFLWRLPGKDYHREYLLLWFLIPVKGDRMISLGEATGQGLGGIQLRTRKFMGTLQIHIRSINNVNWGWEEGASGTRVCCKSLMACLALTLQIP